MTAQTPTVSVWMTTYNHEKFISQAIEGVLMQETSFPFELVIGEDESTDGTRAICEDYAKRYPGIIRLHLRSRNDLEKKKYAAPFMHNFLATLAACRGQYIALCEGDDYWTDPKKLQKQVDFLEAHPEYVMCFHQARVINSRGERASESIYPLHLEKDHFTTDDFCRREWFYPTATIVYRRYDDFDYPEWAFNCASGDITLMLLLSLRGPSKFIPGIMSVYRIHAGGFSAAHVGYRKVIDMIYLLESFNHHTHKRFASSVYEGQTLQIRERIPVDWRDAYEGGYVKRLKKSILQELYSAKDGKTLNVRVAALIGYNHDHGIMAIREYFRQCCWSDTRQRIPGAIRMVLKYDPLYLFKKECIGTLIPAIFKSNKRGP